MKILIVSVCYNNFSDALVYIKSLEKAITIDLSIKKINFYLVNNGVEFSKLEINLLKEINLIEVCIIENRGNVGYFPGCFIGLQEAINEYESYDILIVSNVDLKVSEDIFSKLALLRIRYEKCNVVLAPSIISLSENKDRNPKVLNRFTKKEMKKYLFLYWIPYLHYFYKRTLYKFKKYNDLLLSGAPIYAPHGSFIIFLNGRKLWNDFLSYPIFLFGEEIHIGEQALINNIPIYYHQELKIIDSDHASTGKENEFFIRKHNYKAINYLINRYWQY